MGPGYCCVGCCVLVEAATGWASLGERETEPRWEPNRLANVSPAKEERRTWRGGEEDVVLSSDMLRGIGVDVSVCCLGGREVFPGVFLELGMAQRPATVQGRLLAASCMGDNVPGAAVCRP